jgi:hypothetical protein
MSSHSRHHPRRRKIRAACRHVAAAAAAILPVGAVYTFIRAFFLTKPERLPFFRLSLGFLAGGLVALSLFAILRADKIRRHAERKRRREAEAAARNG